MIIVRVDIDGGRGGFWLFCDAQISSELGAGNYVVE